MNFDLFSIMVRVLVLFALLPIHEYAHAYTAYKLGDNTANYQGRLTLNPLAHLDLVGSLGIVFFGFGWAKPVPVNSRNFKNPKMGMLITAAAGPLSNIIMGFILIVIAKVLLLFGGSNSLILNFSGVFILMMQISIQLAVFNLLPIPPLDGSRIVNYILPNRIYYKIMQYERYIFIGMIFILYTGILSRPITFLTSYVVMFLDKITFFIG